MSKIQSIIFSKKYYNIPKLKNYIIKNNFKIMKIDETPHTYRVRQLEPKMFRYFRIIKPSKGVEFVLGFI